ncbi:MAG: MerR family transcriptional regulator [bacterium]|nr:MerR family transcriptional regulator [bacterium]
MNANIEIPDKLTFKLKEVVKITKLDTKVLDYWQREFGGFSPTVNKSGDIFYSRKDVEFIMKLKQWMVVERLGKEKIKKLLNGKEETVNPDNVVSKSVSIKKQENATSEKLKIIRRNLEEILTILDKNDK